MAAFTSAGTGNWSDGPTTWGTGAGVYPGASSAGDTVTIAGHTVTLDVSPANSIATITNSDNTGNIAVGASRTLTLTGNPAITYSGTNTSGFFRVTAGTLTITHDQGAGTVVVTVSSTGYAIVTSSTGAVSISNSGGTACTSTGTTGRCVSHGGSGALTITSTTALTVASGCGPAIVVTAASTNTITGACTSDGTGLFQTVAGSTTLTGVPTINLGYLVRTTGGTFTIDGSPVTTSTGIIVTANATGGTIVWTGSRTIAANTSCNFGTLGGATLNFTNLSLAVTGHFSLVKNTGTITVTGANIARQSAAATAAILNDNTAAACITGASIPSAADTRYGVTRGWADGGTGATTGCGVAGGNGLLEIPNSSSPTGTQDATSDACVVSGKKYGSPQRTGSASAGGGGGAKIIGG